MLDPKAKTRAEETAPDPFVGRTFHGYRLESVLGRGGMGTVYKATQLSLGRAVAVKILAPDLLADAQFIERFHREADALSRLNHPNVVNVYDRGEIDGHPYLTMEYVEGPSLRGVMRGGPLAPADALRIVSSVLSALRHAHERGIVHRDIKPENVLLSRGDVVKVADFGLSRLLGPEDTTRLTRTHLVLGTYEYMAPEQRQHAREADSRSDLYATGVVLYEMLTGELPIGHFDLPSRARPDACDGRIDRLIERSLEKDPERRFQEAGEMADAVSAILERPAPEPMPAATASASSSPSSVGYRPIRLEYHLDNVATIDHVLGTGCYILGLLTLFGAASFRRWLPIGALPFFAFFVAGWYVRETAADLRRYKASARTAQAVIAIFCAFTGVLLPFTIYSLWVLFSHRGRTYYDARGRGLDERAAAVHTQRLLFDDAVPGPAPAPAPPLPPAAPRPSQIPVQSIVTSEVTSAAAGRPGKSGWVRAGQVLAWVTLAFAFYFALEGHDLAATVTPVLAVVSGGLLVVGLFHSLLTPGVRGAIGALAFLLLLAAGSWYCARMDGFPFDPVIFRARFPLPW